MIYIFKGCSGICALPFQICEKCGKACHDVCGDICRPIAKCCREICKTINGIFTRPLGIYVLGTIALMFFQCVGVMLSLRHAKPQLTTSADEIPVTTPAPVALAPGAPTPAPLGPQVSSFQGHLVPQVCEGGSTVFMLILLEGVIALINFGSAIYIQRQTWEGLQDIVDIEEAEAAAGGKRVKRRNVAQLIMDSSGQIFCYDVCFCFYFFFIIGELAIAAYGTTLVGEPYCDPSGWPATVMYVGWIYPILVGFFAIGWVILLHCHSAAEDCCRPCGGFSCCFGERPLPRHLNPDGSDSDYDEEYGRPSQMQMRPGYPAPDRPPPSRKCCCCCIPVPHF
jgi:hypothetical protein